MKRRTAVALVVTAIMAVALGSVTYSKAASTTNSASRATIPTLTVGLDATVSSVDPATQGQTFITSSMGLENLMRIGAGNSLQPWLALSYTQPSPATYVYHLRHGVKFWDGNEMTATDVANAMNYYRYPQSMLSQDYASVKNIKAVGRYTVVVTLKHPDAEWRYVPALYSWIFEKKFEDAHKTTMGQPGTLIMGTGPFEYDSIDPTSGMELSANPHYWHGAVTNIQHISVKFITDDTSLGLAMRSGEIDVAPSISSDVQGFKGAAAGAATLLTNINCGTNGPLMMNTKVAPWSDVHVRRAVAYAINRADVAAAAGLPGSTPVYTLILPSELSVLAPQAQVTNLLKSVPTYPFSIAKAKQELAKSASPNGFSQTWEMTTLGGSNLVAEAIAGDLSKIGINLTVKTVSVAQWFDTFKAPHTAGLNLFGFGCDNPDPGLYPGLLLGNASLKGNTPLNFPQYNPPGMDGLVTAAVAATSPAKRFAIYSKILKTEAAAVPYVTLVTSPTYGAATSKFTWKGFGWFEENSTPWPLDITSS